jgi:hypothetical protein
VLKAFLAWMFHNDITSFFANITKKTKTNLFVG